MNLLPRPAKLSAQKLSSDQGINAILAKGASSWRGKARRILWWTLTIAGMAFLYSSLHRGENAKAVRFVTQPATVAPMRIIVTATGSVQPINVVDISSELSGIIRKVFVDYNDTVKAGQALIELDTVTLTAQVASARASLAAAKARVVQAQATVIEKQTALRRTSALAERNYSSQSSLDSAKAEYDRAVATLESAKADVEVAEAVLKQNETSLSKARIYSPIDGVVLRRSVEPGQTVATSLQTVTLLTVAEDLRKMELHVDVDEADIGKVKEGQEATFTVEAYQNKNFPARIKQVRYASDTTNGVVTYKAVLGFDNSDLLLRPGMTATAEILIENIENALAVPNAALRFKPPPAPEAGSGGLLSKLFFRIPRQPQPDRTGMKSNKRLLYILKDGKPEAVEVIIGSTDGARTQIVEGSIAAGDPVIVDASVPST